MRIHPVRLVVVVAAILAIWSTYQVWIIIGGVGGVDGWHLGWTAQSWLTHDAHVVVIAAVVAIVIAVYGQRGARLRRAASIAVSLAGVALGVVVTVEVVRMLDTKATLPEEWAPWTDLGRGVYVLGLAALGLFGAGLYPARPGPPRPYVEPEYRL